MKVLITNDDGINAEGIQVLASQLVKDGYEVTVIAPKEDSSGAGAGVGQVYLRHNSIKFDRIVLPGLESVEAYSIDALPAMTVLAGFLGFLDFKPDLVVSGINNGLNVGRSSLHSGTVGAALTSQHFSTPSIAISTEWDERPNYETAAIVACELLNNLELKDIKVTLNVNVPSKPLELINGIKITKLSNYGLIKTVSKNHETGTLYLDLSPHELNLSDETDISALRSNYVSVTPIETVRQLDHETLNAHIFDIIDHVWNQSVKR